MDAKKPGILFPSNKFSRRDLSKNLRRWQPEVGMSIGLGTLSAPVPTFLGRVLASCVPLFSPSLKCRGEAATSEPCHQKTLDSKMSKCSGGESNNGQMYSDLGRPCFKYKPGTGRCDNRVGSVSESHSLQHWRQKEAVKESTGSREGVREMGMQGR